MPESYRRFRIESRPDVSVLTLAAGNYFERLETMDVKRELLVLAKSQKPAKVIISFEEIANFSTEFVSALISFKRTLCSAEPKAVIVLAQLATVLREVFHIIDPHQSLFRIYDTVSEAYEAVK